MTAAELIAILQTMPPAAVVVLGQHNSDTVVAIRNSDISRVALRAVPWEYRDTYETVAQADEHDCQGVQLG